MSKKVQKPVPILASQSLSASFSSPATEISFGDNVGYQINVTTTNSTGTFTVEVSDDYETGTANVPAITGHWSALALDGTPTAAGANDTINISLNQLPHRYVRISYASSVAGTGVADIYVTYKSVGA